MSCCRRAARAGSSPAGPWCLTVRVRAPGAAGGRSAWQPAASAISTPAFIVLEAQLVLRATSRDGRDVAVLVGLRRRVWVRATWLARVEH